MSKLSDAIKARRTFEKVPNLQPMAFTTVSDSLDCPTPWARVYECGATFKVRRVMDKEDAAHVEQTVGEARRMIVEEIFGEFRPMIYAIREDLFMRDHGAAMQKLDVLYRSMFE